MLTQPWPWYVSGPLIGLVVPLLLLLAGREFGVSSSLRHICAATWPGGADYLRYDWRRTGLWNLTFVGGILIGGVIAGLVLANPEPIAIAESTRAALSALGIRDFSGLVPSDLIGWSALVTLRGFVAIVVGGFLVGFGTRYAGGCTSGHGITGLATLQPASMLAVAGFFAGGLFVTWVVLPWLL
ncbi:MAG TPA: YeeE/YedE thiosulfate transporter family protein [Gemmatimonadota bacterium]|nr:YeeE/YedE thiosulfate transporter family protein [Gemmatimonadota bacterium]